MPFFQSELPEVSLILQNIHVQSTSSSNWKIIFGCLILEVVKVLFHFSIFRLGLFAQLKMPELSFLFYSYLSLALGVTFSLTAKRSSTTCMFAGKYLILYLKKNGFLLWKVWWDIQLYS